MKKILLLPLLLGGCVTSTSSLIPTESQISEKAKQIQGYTRIACSFVPTAATIGAIVSAGATASAFTIAADICSAITNMPLADGPRRQAKVYGVVLKGEFKK